MSRKRTKEKKSSKRLGYRFVKRCFDFLFSLCVLVVLMPVILIVALIVFIVDPHGSPFFVQTRVGKNGKEFRMYKIRSMVCDAEDQLSELEKQGKNIKNNGHSGEGGGPTTIYIPDDPRVLPFIGNFIRKTSIDELPQFLNVLKGEMSVVGPRPALPREAAQYNDFHRRRLEVKQGLTCYWQCSDNRDEISTDEWIKLDINYVEECSVWVDLKIILRTIKVVLTAQGH